MKLKKNEIQFIDNYLKKGGIKYWDVRLEMVDHLVSDIENYEDATDFETAFNHSLVNAGWDKNLEAVHMQSWKSTNKIYRKMHFVEILKLLKNPATLIGFVAFYLLFNRIAVIFSEYIKLVAFMVLLVPILVLLYESLKMWRKKLGKSVNMQYGLFYFSFGLIMINLPLQLLPKSHLHLWLPFLMTVYLLMMVAGYKVYKYAYKKMLKLKCL